MKINSYQKNYFDKLQLNVMTFLYRKDLRKLATLYGSDKWNHHTYAEHYNKHFTPLRLKKLNILEIGVGGYVSGKSGGQSLRMWKTFFPNSMIYGIDIVDKKHVEEDRIKVFQGSQDDQSFLKKIIDETGGFDIIIDDGSHVNEQVIKSFNILFPALNDGGIYVVEDTFTSYWPSVDDKWLTPGSKNSRENWWQKMGGSLDINAPHTTINFFKSLVNCLNHQEFLKPGYSPSYLDKHIVAMHFYHNLVILYKGNNNEPSPVMINNTLSPSILKTWGVQSLEELGIESSNLHSAP